MNRRERKAKAALAKATKERKEQKKIDAKEGTVHTADFTQSDFDRLINDLGTMYNGQTIDINKL